MFYLQLCSVKVVLMLRRAEHADSSLFMHVLNFMQQGMVFIDLAKA